MTLGLTLIRPWPTAVIHLGKQTENRTWKPPAYLLGQDIYIHAGLTWDHLAVDFIELAVGKRPQTGDCPLGVIVGVVRLAGILQKLDIGGYTWKPAPGVSSKWLRHIARTSPWFVGPVGWVFDNVRPLSKPVACTGAQKLWTVPDEVEHQVRRQLGRMEEGEVEHG